MQCITSVSYSFLINGTNKGDVTPSRGIRQGDPLSPSIFILCSEVLSGLCRNAQDRGWLKGIKVGRGSPPINHLLFADDTMFFCNTDKRSCRTLKGILTLYKDASGQTINLQKSSISFSSKTTSRVKGLVKSRLGISNEGGKGKYLGLPELFGRKKKDVFASIVDRIRQRALSWSTKFLSSAGKMVMLKSVLSAMPTYAMTCFKLPVSLCSSIQSVLTRFWWDSKPDKKSMCWVSWDRLAQGKKKGGLGFRDIQSFNQALLAKQSWKILTNPHCLLSRVLLGKYSRGKPFLECQEPSSTSHGWRGILWGRDLLIKHIGKLIGDGRDTSIWRDPWLSVSSQRTPFGPALESQLLGKVADLFSPNSTSWDLEKIRATLPLLEQEILCIQPSCLGAKDRFAWLKEKSGIYTAKSGYYSLQEELEGENFDFVQRVWQQKLPPKIKLFIWKIVQEALPTGALLVKRKIRKEGLCPRCGEEETLIHMLFRCSFAQQIWDATPFAKPIFSLQIEDFNEILTDMELVHGLPPTGIFKGTLFPWLCWSIWKARNNLLFNEKITPPKVILTSTLRDVREWQAAQFLIPVPKPMPVLWGERRCGWDREMVTCNTDAAWSSDTKQSGFGWTFLTKEKHLVAQSSGGRSHVGSALVAESLALKEALEHALDLGIGKLRVLSDSQQLIRAIKGGSGFSELHGVLFDISHLSLSFIAISFEFIPRQFNSVADSLAKQSLRLASL